MNDLKTILQQMNLGEYRIEPIIRKRNKAAWRVWHDQSTWVLKKSPKPLSRWRTIQHFSEQMRQHGAPVPRIKSVLSAGKHTGSYVLMQWVGQRVPNVMRSAEMHAVVRALARWHRASQLVLQKTKRNQIEQLPSLLGKWALRYDKRTFQLQRMIERILAHKGNWGDPKQDYLAKKWLQLNAEKWLRAARTCTNFFRGHEYEQDTKKHRHRPSICHQDFSQGNLRILGEEIYALDVDGLTIDSPVRDLRKLYIKIASERGWNERWPAELWQSYTKIVPLDAFAKSVLQHDLKYPHRFFGWCKAVERAIHQPHKLNSPRRASYAWLQQLIKEENKRVFEKINL